MKVLEFTKKADKQISKFPYSIQDQIENALLKLSKQETNLDIAKIEGTKNIYRLRTGSYRIFFRYEKNSDIITILEILIKGQAYR